MESLNVSFAFLSPGFSSYLTLSNVIYVSGFLIIYNSNIEMKKSQHILEICTIATFF